MKESIRMLISAVYRICVCSHGTRNKGLRMLKAAKVIEWVSGISLLGRRWGDESGTNEVNLSTWGTENSYWKYKWISHQQIISDM